jgi:four helix bundle protein
MTTMSRSPKSEIRDPKEIRKPRSDGVAGRAEPWEDWAFWTWGEVESAEGSVLREGCDAPPRPPQELLERTALFAEAIIRFARQVPHGPVTNRLIDQLVDASSSVAANYCEADDAVSGKDFKKSIGTCRKESKEAMLFLRLIATAEESRRNEARKLWREAKELNLIFGSIWRK